MVTGDYNPSYEMGSQGGGEGGSVHGSDKGNGRSRARNVILKALCLMGGALLIRKLTKASTRWDHARIVSDSLSGEKFSSEQAARDPMNYFNLRMLTCPATTMADGSRVLYFEQAFWRTPEKPYRQVNMIWEELGSKFEELLKGRKPGVVASLIAACCRFHTHERECCRALAHAVNPGSASPNCIVPRILFLENYSCTAGRSDWQWPSGNKMSILGCLMLQSIFKYPNELIQQFCSSFASMEVNHILEAAKDPGGGRVIEAFLSSNAPLKHKHRVISKFRGHFGELAQQPASSFTVAKCFSAADVALKEVITSELSQIQVELSRTKHGPYLLKSCDVARYSKGPDQWRSSQSLKQSTRQAFAEVFGSQVEAKREDDCGGLVPCNEEASDIPNIRSKNRKRERELHKGEHEMVNSVLSKEDVSKLEHSMADLGFAMHKHGKTGDVNGKAGMNVGQSEKHKDKMAGKQKSLSNREFKKNSEKDAIEEIFGRKDKVKKVNKGREMHKAHDKLADAEPVVQKIIDPAVQSVLRSIEKGTKKKKRPAIDDPSAFNAKNQKQRRQMVYI